jgi:hypothetical protein
MDYVSAEGASRKGEKGVEHRAGEGGKWNDPGAAFDKLIKKKQNKEDFYAEPAPIRVPILVREWRNWQTRWT